MKKLKYNTESRFIDKKALDTNVTTFFFWNRSYVSSNYYFSFSFYTCDAHAKPPFAHFLMSTCTATTLRICFLPSGTENGSKGEVKFLMQRNFSSANNTVLLDKSIMDSPIRFSRAAARNPLGEQHKDGSGSNPGWCAFASGYNCRQRRREQKHASRVFVRLFKPSFNWNKKCKIIRNKSRTFELYIIVLSKFQEILPVLGEIPHSLLQVNCSNVFLAKLFGTKVNLFKIK